MSFVIDTDTCSAYLKGNGRVFSRFQQHGGGLYLSVLTLGELYTWAYRQSASITTRLESIRHLMSDAHVLPVDEGIALAFGTTRAALLNRGVVVPEVDLLIAATALQFDFTVVTNNERHFRMVPGLRVQNWMT